MRRELRVAQGDRAAGVADSRRGGCAYAPGGETAGVARQRGPHARRPTGADAAGRGQRRAGIAGFQPADRADLVDQSAERRRLSGGGADAAVPRRFHRRADADAVHGPAQAHAQMLTNVGRTQRGTTAGGGQPLQRAAALRCVRQCAGPRPGLGGQRHQSVLDSIQARSCAKGSFIETRGQVADHEGIVYGAGHRAWCSRSCWCTS